MGITRKLVFLTLLGFLFSWVVSATAQQSGQMSGNDVMIGHVMMNKRPSSSQQADHAASVYAKLCASCHGDEGEGDGPAATAMNPKPGDFTDCERMATHPDKMLFEIIKEGGQAVGHSPMMPPWKGVLTDPEIHDLVAYVRSFCKT